MWSEMGIVAASSMQTACEIVFWACLIAVAATYFGYPIVLALALRFRRQHSINEETPSVTLVISAYNEEAVIGEKLENALSLDYPSDRLEIMVISDDSDDATDEIVDAYRDRGVLLCRQEPRRGKSAGLTRFVPETQGEIIVFSDANSMYERDAIRKLVRHFADPGVGFVVGHQRYVEADSLSSVSESLYWRYETWIKIQESRLGAAVGGDGAIYAIRAELFQPLKPDDISDFTLPLKIVTRGYRGVFDRYAICYEQTADSIHGEFKRKARIVNRSLRAVIRVPQVLNPFRVGLFAFHLGIHKVIRWFVPFLLIALLSANIWLALSGPKIYIGFLVLQVLCYLIALLGLIPGIRRWRVAYIPWYFCVINVAAAVGIVQCLFGRTVAIWNPERRATSGKANVTEESSGAC